MCPRAASTNGWRRRGGKINLERDYYPWARRVASGIVDIDEVYDSAGGMILVTDPVNDITLDFCLAEHIDESVVKTFLRGLCGGGLAVHAACTDRSNLYAGGKLGEVWRGVIHQHCVFHLLKETNQDILRAVAAVRKKIKKLRSRRRGPACKRGRPRQQRLDKRKFIAQHRFLFTRRPDNLSDEDRQHLATMGFISPELAVIRRFTDQLHGFCLQSRHLPPPDGSAIR